MIPWLLNGIYLLALLLLSPWLVWRAIRTGRYRRGLLAKLFGQQPVPPQPGCVWFHGVSLGEIHLLRTLVPAFRKRHPKRPCVISTTTETGYDEARRTFPDLPVIFFPFDFSWAVRRTLKHLQPALVVLAEGEYWPNFLIAAQRLGVPVAVVNGRMSPRSFRRYQSVSWLARWLLNKLTLLAVQTEAYDACLCALGADRGRIRVTGSIKFDGVETDRRHRRTEELRRLLSVTSDDLVWIAGSTQAPEEELVLRMYPALRAAHPNLRLVLVPRHPERFDEVASLVQRARLRLVRRSRLSQPLEDRSAVVLVDSMGELMYLWGLCEIAFVGGSLDGKRGGQNMLQPAAVGAAVLFGPHVWNFKDQAQRLVEAGGAIQVADAAALEANLRRLLANASERQALGLAGREFVLSQQGATRRTIDLLGELLPPAARTRAAS
jgi:3-deoxy-D-manno-octulosonic-acid transferase